MKGIRFRLGIGCMVFLRQAQDAAFCLLFVVCCLWLVVSWNLLFMIFCIFD